MLFNGPFNKVVRSHEALFLGLLLGIIVGVILMITLNIPIKQDNFKSAVKLCGVLDNVKIVHVSYTGKLQRVVCNDQRTFSNF